MGSERRRTAIINGTFNLQGTTAVFDAKNGASTIWGIVNVIGNGASFNTTCTTCVSEITFAAGSYYNHKMNGGTIPYAISAPSATINITGTTTTAPVFPSSWASSYNLGNLNINTPASSVNISGGSGIDTIKGALTIKSTGTGVFNLQNFIVTGVFTLYKGKMLAITGTFDNDVILDTGRIEMIGSLFMNGDVTKTAADSLVDDGTTLYFGGIRHQNISIGGAFVVAPFSNNSSYVLENPSGATLTGIIPVNQYSNVRILAGAFNGNGAFSYAATGATLNYEGAPRKPYQRWNGLR